jgi:hypothetical protein
MAMNGKRLIYMIELSRCPRATGVPTRAALPSAALPNRGQSGEAGAPAGTAGRSVSYLCAPQESRLIGRHRRFTRIHRRERHVPALRDAFTNGREWAGQRTKATADAQRAASTFQDGAEWVRRVLIPAIERGNPELEPEHVAFQLDLNLDPRSTNHAHADFWLSETGEGQRAVGPKHSINILGGQSVWLFKAGGPGRELGTIDRCGSDEIQILLQNAAEEFGRLVGWRRRRQHGGC